MANRSREQQQGTKRFRQYVSWSSGANKVEESETENVSGGRYNSSRLLARKKKVKKAIINADKKDEFDSNWQETLEENNIDFLRPNFSMEVLYDVYEDLSDLLTEWEVEMGISGLQEEKDDTIEEDPVGGWKEKIKRREKNAR